MQFLKTKESKVSFSNNILRVRGNSAVLFIHENEKIEKKIVLDVEAVIQIFSIYSKNAEIKNSFVVPENCKLNIVDIFYGNTNVENIIPLENQGCSLNLIAKGVAKENETANYIVLASIGKNGVNANIDIKEHAYILGKNACISFLPGLEIINNNVSAKHASTISQLDEEQIFYLMTRGFSEKQAKKELIFGFFARESEFIRNIFEYKI